MNRQLLGLVATLGAAALPGIAVAQDFYFIPEVKAGIEYHDNLQFVLDPSQDESVEGYIANLSALFGWRGPRGRTEIKPRVQFQQYPDRDELQRSNQYLDLRSNYDFLRSEFNLVGSYRREDEYQAEIAEAGFNEFDPEDPTTDESGRIILLSGTRTRTQIRPDFLHHFNDRLGLGIDGMYQVVGYSADLNNLGRTDYKYYETEVYLQWALSQRTDLVTGLYGARYRSDVSLDDTDSEGLSLKLKHRWTETWNGTVTASIEESKQDRVGAPGTVSSSDWGLEFDVVHQGQVSQFRMSAGRTFSPTGSESRAQVDQIRAQYSRSLTQRWQFFGAARAYSRQEVGDSSSDDRAYLSGQLGLRWNVTRTWFASGGYSYIRQRYENEDDTRADQVLTLEFGYRGLSPQQ